METTTTTTLNGGDVPGLRSGMSHSVEKFSLSSPPCTRKGQKKVLAHGQKSRQNLGQLDGFAFTTKAIRDHHNGLINSRQAKVNAEVRETGTGTEEVPEIERLLDEIIADIDKYNEINADKNDTRKAKETVETRKKAMETYGETRKRNKEEGYDSPSPSPSVKRRSGTETLRFLMEKQEQAKKEHEDNLKLKTEEISLRKAEVQNMNTAMTSVNTTLNNTLQVQQQQQQQQQQQMMQQTQLFAALIEKLNKN